MGVSFDFWNGGGDDFTYQDPTAVDPHADPNRGYVNGSYNPGTYQQQPWNPATQSHWTEGMIRGDGEVDPYLHPSYYLDPANPQNNGQAGFAPEVGTRLNELNAAGNAALATAAAPHSIAGTKVSSTNVAVLDPRGVTTAGFNSNSNQASDRAGQLSAFDALNNQRGITNQDNLSAQLGVDLGGYTKAGQNQQGAYDFQQSDVQGRTGNAIAQRALNPALTANYNDQSIGGQNQASLISRLNDDLSGKQPSLAEIQLRKGQQDNARQSLAIASSAQGGAGNQAAALRQALTGNVTAGQETNRTAAGLRAQEYAQARGELGTATTAQRGAEEAGLSTAVSAAGQARGQDISSAANMAGTAGAQRSADISNYGIMNSLYGTGRGQDIQTAGMGIDARNNMRAGDLAAGAQDIGANEFTAGLNQQTNQHQADITAAQRAQQAQIDAQRAQADAQLGLGYFGAGNTAATAYAGLYGSTYGQGLSAEEAYRNSLLTNSQGERGISVGTQQNNMRQSEDDWSRYMQYAQMAGTGLLLASDETLKTDAKPADSGRVAELLDELKPREFRYKAPDLYGDGDKFGVMAQMLERSAIGRGLVHETPAGKMVDVPQSVGALLAVAGEMHERLKRVEAKKARRVAA